MKKGLLQFLTLLFAFCFLATAASAATFTVTKTADSNDGTCDADCSLREAIGAANAAGTDDVIEFSALFNSPQTILVSLGEMTVTAAGSLAISGPGADLLTIDGNSASRIITLSATVVASIDGITFTRGNGVGTVNNNSGGAIQTNGGSLTITNSVLTNNTTSGSAGAIRNSGTGSMIFIDNCVFSNNTSTGSSAGAIQNFSTSVAVIRNSTFSGNTSNSTTGGGAMQANGQVRIENSTFSGNNANSGNGGAIQTNGSYFLLTNVTMSGNTASLNGGGFHRGTTNVNGFIRNSIIAGNTAGSPDVSNSAGGLTSEGNNIIGAVGTSTGWVASDLLDTNPMLGPLADNGGFGSTFLPLAGSPAINAGQNCVLDSTCSANNPAANVDTDQRGIARPAGGVVDIGAVEVAAAAANVEIGGRVLGSNGSPVAGALVTITLATPTFGKAESAATISNSFGYYKFDSVPTGATYNVTASAKQYVFGVVQVTPSGNVNDLDIIAEINALK